jgi:hypothetical protein
VFFSELICIGKKKQCQEWLFEQVIDGKWAGNIRRSK